MLKIKWPFTINLAVFLFITIYSLHISAQQVVPDKFPAAELYADVNKYVNFGIHRTGTDGDNKTSEWIKGILDNNGFKKEYLTFPVEQFFPDKTDWKIGKKSIEVFPGRMGTEIGNEGVGRVAFCVDQHFVVLVKFSIFLVKIFYI